MDWTFLRAKVANVKIFSLKVKTGIAQYSLWRTATQYDGIWLSYFISFVQVLVAFISHIGDIVLNVKPHHVEISFAVIKTDILKYYIISIFSHIAFYNDKYPNDWHFCLLLNWENDRSPCPGNKVLVLVLSLALSFPVEGASYHPIPFQVVPEVSWISYEQMPVMNSQKPDPGGCGALLGQWGRRRVAGDCCQWSPVDVGAQTLPPREGGHTWSWSLAVKSLLLSWSLRKSPSPGPCHSNPC